MLLFPTIVVDRDRGSSVEKRTVTETMFNRHLFSILNVKLQEKERRKMSPSEIIWKLCLVVTTLGILEIPSSACSQKTVMP